MIISFRNKWVRCLFVLAVFAFVLSGIQRGYHATEAVFLDWFHKDEQRGQVPQNFEPSQYILAQFSTPIQSRAPGRLHNQNKAIGIFNDQVIKPGDTFSVIDILGPLTAENGWKMGEKSVVAGSQLIDGMAGGICQAVTTLYNAALLSDFEIIKRWNHAIVLTYVDPGRDAAIYVDGGQDLVIKNNHPFPVAIKGEMTKDKMVFRLVTEDPQGGEWKKHYEIDLETHKTGEISYGQIIKKNPAIPVGERKITHEGINGYRNVKLFRIVKKDDQIMRRELISQNSYLPFPEEVTVGTKKVQ